MTVYGDLRSLAKKVDEYSEYDYIKGWVVDELNDLASKYEGSAPQSEPNLGLATTRELLQELNTRARITMPKGSDAGFTARITDILLSTLPDEHLNYRTVGSKPEIEPGSQIG